MDFLLNLGEGKKLKGLGWGGGRRGWGPGGGGGGITSEELGSSHLQFIDDIATILSEIPVVPIIENVQVRLTGTYI